MTIKEYNKLRRAVYEVALENAEIADAVASSGTAYVYEILEGEAHFILTLSHRTQLNARTLKDIGVKDPDSAEARLILTLNRATKCATF